MAKHFIQTYPLFKSNDLNVISIFFIQDEKDQILTSNVWLNLVSEYDCALTTVFILGLLFNISLACILHF